MLLLQNAKKYPADRVRGSSAKYNTYPQHGGLAPNATDLASAPLQPSALHDLSAAALQQLTPAQELHVTAVNQPPAAQSLGHTPSATASGISGERTADSKRKRFSEDQVSCQRLLVFS